MQLQVPNFLEKILTTGNSLAPFATTTLTRIGNYVDAIRLVFFPEYTDHGKRHIELTLQTAIDLATHEAKKHITQQDAAVLVAAVGLHDFGMHLTRDGFESLIATDSIWEPIPGLDSKPWSVLWYEFFAEAKRYDGRKLRSLFGDKYQPIKPLPEKGEAWDTFDHLLVGEFLRRHHPRLAHEIAIYGFPGKDGESKIICPKETPEDEFLSDMSGFVARSHGMNLRSCIPYLEEKYRNKVDPRRVHSVYLMILLRLADYFQIQASRAPMERTNVASFHSGFSEGEWMLHQCVSDVNFTDDDPEALMVDAVPQDVVTFLRMEGWLAGLQDELDKSWAVLGEIYGRQTHNQLDSLGVKIRRVKSNLDDVDAFARTVNYLPAKISFDSANSDLLKLLVGPLYDNQLGIGIRELVQNAVDAVRELHDLIENQYDLGKLDTYKQKSDVLVRFECDDEGVPVEVSVTDKGIGMTPDVVQEYFLKAGASFRRSDAWRKSFEDTDGRSRILRTGRFGVGALAAFLLGDEIEVSTRHATLSKKQGIKFKASVDSDAIEIVKADCPVGTQIKIQIPKRLQEDFSYLVPDNWTKKITFADRCAHFFLKKPSVKIEFSHLKKDYPYAQYLPQPESDALSPWRSFYTEDYGTIYWTYNSSFPELSCNGIPILRDIRRSKLSTPVRYIEPPKISMFDRDGRLPVNLPRTGLQTETVPFANELCQSVTDDLIAHALTAPIKKCEGDWLDGKHKAFEGWDTWYRRYRPYWDEYPKWLICKKGFILNDEHLIKAFNPKTIVFVAGGDEGYASWGDVIRKAISDDTLVMYYFSSSLFKKVKGTFKRAMEMWSPLNSVVFDGGRVFLSQNTYKALNQAPGKELRKLLPNLGESSLVTSWHSATTENKVGQFKKIEKVMGQIHTKPNSPIIVSVFSVDGFVPTKDSDVVAKRWLEVLGTPIIPFAAAPRKRLESKVKEQIGPHIALTRKEMLAREKAKKVKKKEKAEVENDA